MQSSSNTLYIKWCGWTEKAMGNPFEVQCTNFGKISMWSMLYV